ncbi:MAG: ROK family protein [Burkholderiales bacterium]|nr:ROK family protein [Burkholderiales bacterium]PZN01689.1 MAG: fructokinase [Pseudomonadota bacterium]
MRIGIDLGGTKIEIAAFDAAGALLLRRRVPTPQGDYWATLRTIARLVEEAEAEFGGRAQVGVGTPGSPSPATGLMRNANSVCLNGRPLREDLERLLGREIRIANDANCFALSEARDGAGAGAQSVFGVILGTGVGGGLVVDGRLIGGANAIAGEWGHNPLETGEAQPPACYCGRYSCIETYLSGPGLVADHVRHGGRETEVPAIVAAAEAGDPRCLATLERYERRLARALATVINIFDPEVIVLGGGLSNIARLYERVPLLWREHIFSDVVRTRLLPNRHGDSSGVRGAAWLWG